MTRTKIRLLRIALAAIAVVGCLLVSEKFAPTKPGSLVTEAHAIIGRPLTPMSYAGVARRTTRRAVTYGAAAGAAVYAAPACAQVVNAYGQLTTVCR
jgi:Na+/proline symporter